MQSGHCSADIAQLAERDFAMVEAAGSNPAVRFTRPVRLVAQDARFSTGKSPVRIRHGVLGSIPAASPSPRSSSGKTPGSEPGDRRFESGTGCSQTRSSVVRALG